MTKVGIVDYGGGNLRSLCRAVELLGYKVHLISKAEHMEGLTHILFPGQGAYGDCLQKLEDRSLKGPLLEWIESDKPFFGICVGYQLLFNGSEEAPEDKGFEVISGEIVKFRDESLKVPHMGWNALKGIDTAHPYWAGMREDPYFYFVHSYYSEGVPSDVAAGYCEYGKKFTACVIKGNLLATQFHPEKSQENGILLLKNFLNS